MRHDSYREADHKPNEVELDLLSRAADGDRQATEVLLIKYKWLVRQKAGSMYMKGAGHEDVIQEGMIGLYQAIIEYQPRHRVPFSAFAAYCVTARITDAVRKSSRLKHQPLNESISLQSIQHSEEQSQQHLLDLFADKSMPNPEATLLERENLMSLQYFIQNELSKLERQVVLQFLENPKYEQIAHNLDCSLKTVDNALRRARNKFTIFRKYAIDLKTKDPGAGK